MASISGEAFITSVTVGELARGIGQLPAGRRRSVLDAKIRQALVPFDSRILAFTDVDGWAYGAVIETRKKLGRPISAEDGMIAACCLTRDAGLFTRNTSDFAGLGLDLANPWLTPAAPAPGAPRD